MALPHRAYWISLSQRGWLSRGIRGDSSCPLPLGRLVRVHRANEPGAHFKYLFTKAARSKLDKAASLGLRCIHSRNRTYFDDRKSRYHLLFHLGNCHSASFWRSARVLGIEAAHSQRRPAATASKLSSDSFFVAEAASDVSTVPYRDQGTHDKHSDFEKPTQPSRSLCSP